jgi:hypothetical protein
VKRGHLRTLAFVGLALWACIRCPATLAQTTTSVADAAHPQTSDEVLEKIDALIEQNARLEQQNRELMDQIRALRQSLATNPTPAPAATAPPTQPTSPNPPSADGTVLRSPEQQGTGEKKADGGAGQEEQETWGKYTPNLGYKVANTEYGDMSVAIYTYARYLNQRGLDNTYTNASGAVSTLQRRQDFQLNKLQIKFLGWVLSQKFRYFLYAWTSNATQGLGAQVVLAGNLNYAFNKHFNLGLGIYSLPGTRSVEGNFPFWLGVDSRLIADEFFRPSYSSGIQLRGDITKTLRYQTMLANNLSTLGVPASALNNKFNTWANALVWMPTTGEFGQGFGDFEQHDKVATRLAAHFTRSDETTESQSPTEAFDNTQIRVSDGTVIFTPNLFGPGITVQEVRYRMATLDAGVKYRGFALEGEHYWRWLDNFKGPNTAGLPQLYDHGFQLQASSMVVPKTLQLYVGGSTIHGKFGQPYDFRTGLNWFPWKNRVVRWNNEGLYLYRSPVGYTSVPFALGGTGWVYHSTVELAF